MMRVLLGGLAAAALMASCATDALATERTRTLQSYYCPATNATLRVIFDASDNTAVVARIRKPNIRLQRAESDGENFRYVRNNGTHELTGNAEQVRWRVGRAEWDCRAVG